MTSLRSLRVPIIDSGLCGKLYYSKGVVTPRMLCAGYVEGKFDACQVRCKNRNKQGLI